MKKIIILYLIFQFSHSLVNAQVEIGSTISTVGGKGEYATHIDSLGRGGFMVLPTIATRDSIPVKRRKFGMLVYVQSVDSMYKLNSTSLDISISNSNWLTLGLFSAEKVKADAALANGSLADTARVLRAKILGDSTRISSRITNVDNTTDSNKPISTATQTALDLKANLISPTLTGTPTAPTPADGTNTTQIATTAFVNTSITASSNSIGGVSSSTIAEMASTIAAATPNNTSNTLVKRDGSGNFSAGTVTASLTGNVTGNLTGNVVGNVTGNLAGNASTTTKLATARSIYGNAFDGTSDLTQKISGEFGGTGATNIGKTINLGGNILTASDFTTAGSFNTTLTSTGATNITLPTTGTIATLAGTESLTNKTIVSPSILTPTISSPSLTGSPTAPTPADNAISTEVATAAFVKSQISSAATPATLTAKGIIKLANDLGGTADLPTVNSVGGVNSSTITTIAQDIANATNNNTPNTLVKRDASGNFIAGNITASLTGNVSGNLTGDVTGNVVGNVTGNLAGNASTTTQLATGRSIYGNSFNGTSDLGQAIAGTFGGTGKDNGSKTITLGGNILTANDFTTAGNFNTTLTSIGATNITLPTTGTIATLAGTETLTNKTILSPTISSPSLTGSPTATTPAAEANSTEVATASFVKSQISSSATPATTTARGIIMLANDLGGTADLPTVNSVGGVNSSTITTINSTINAATSSNTFNTLVKRDGTGNFSAGNITSSLTGNVVGNVVGDVTGSLTGNVTGNVTGNLTGDVTGNLTGNVVGNVTGNLAGNASTTTKLAAPINIYGNPFDGTLELNQAVAGTYGGTGVNNGSKTITLGGNILTASNFTTAGIYSTTLTSIGETNITLPTTGTIATLAGTETLTNKTIVSPNLTGSPTATNPAADANSTEVATAAFVLSRISNAATPATTTAKGIIKLANDLGGTADLPTVNSVGGVISSTIATMNTTINAATATNTVSTLVKRDPSGNFNAGNITASLTGNVTGNLTGNVVGNVTGNLAGNASTTTELATARSIYGNSFNGGADLTQAIAGTFGGTGVNNGSKTITLGGNILTASDFTTAGNFSTTLTSTGATNITLPTTGTIATLAGTETLTNKTIVNATLTGSPTAPNPADAASNTEIATASFVLSKITASSNSIGGVSSSTIAEIASDIASATSSNTSNTLVKRDGSGNFYAGTVIANLSGNASTATKLAATKNIYGNPFDGSLDLTGPILGTYGGTGVNNGTKTISLGGNILTANDFTTAGNFSTTLTSTGATNITLPTTGTIATLAGTETLTNKTIVSPILTGSPIAPTPDLAASGTEVATAAFVKAQISNAATPATTTAKGIIKLANDLGGTADLPTVNSVGGVNSSTITTINSTINAATSTNTINTFVKRDGSGNFSAGIITSNLVGNVTGSLTGNVTGDVTGNVTGDVTGNLTGNVVGNVTGNLSGNASTTTQLQSPRTIYGNSFNGTADLGQAITGTYGGTGVNNGNKTITLGGNILTASDFTTSGNFSTTLISTGVTNITLPTTGTIATLTGTETLTNKTIVSPTISSPSITGTPTAPTPASEANNTQVATTAFVKAQISSSATGATATERGIIKLTNDLGGTADLPTVNSVGGVNSSTIATINTTINAATATNTVNTLVKRDLGGNFSAGNITASLTGNVTGNLTGNVVGNVTGNVTGNLAGNASTTTKLAAPINIYGNPFDGTVELNQAIAGTYGGTGVNNGSKTITLGGNILTASDFTTSGNFSTTLISTGVTNITLPTAGTIATLTGTETLSSKTIVSPTISSPSITGTPTAPTPASDANNTQVATTAFVKAQISSSATGATATERGIIKLANDLGGTADLPTVNSVGGVISSTIATINTTINAATSTNTVNTLVKRDGAGNFSAGTVTAALTGNVTGNLTGNVVGNVTGNLAGNASTTTQLQTARSIYGNSFNGGADLAQAIAGTYGGTGVDNGSKKITLGGNILTASDFTTSGNFSTTLVSTGETYITLPTTGTIATLTGTETLTNKTIVSPTISSPSLTGSPTASNPAADASGTEVATAAFVRSMISSSANGATATERGIIKLANDLGGTADLPTVNSVGGVNSSTIATINTTINAATATNTVSTLVKRDPSGNFSAGTITATLSGNASTSTKLAAPIGIYGNPFDGTLALTSAIAGQYGGTGVNNLGKTITLGGNILTASDFTTAGSFSTTLTSTGETNITLPTTGTIATLAGTETLTNKTILSPSLTGIPTASAPDEAANSTQIATTAFVVSRISASSNSIGGVSSSTIKTISDAIAAATSNNTANTLVKRDGDGNFSAGTITAALAGNASTTTKLATPINIYGNPFDGSSELTSAIAGQYGGTGVNNSGKTITLGGNILTANAFTTAGNFSTTLTSTGATNITLPTTGTIATLAGTETLTNKTIENVNLTGIPNAPTADNSVNNTQIATTAFVKNLLTTSSISGDKIVGVIPVINGGTGQSTFTDGEILIGTTSGTLSKTTISAGSGVTITNGNGSITVSATGSGGTVTSVNPITVTASGSTFTSTVSNANSNPAISLTIPLASVDGTTAGLLSKADYDIFNAKQGALTAGSGISIAGVTIAAAGLTTTNLSSTAGITNGQLANNKITLGSSDLVLGGTYSSVTGLSAVNASNFTGALTGNVTGNLTGDVTGNLTGNVTGNVTGNLAGNASTTTKLAAPINIYGNAFDGTVALTSAIAGTFGGTGVNNGTKTISLGGNISTTADFITAGNFTTTLTSTGSTNVTLPTTGTLATLAGTETLTNKTLVSATLTGSPTAPTPTDVANGTEVATAAFVNSRVIASSSSIGGVSASTIANIAAAVASATSTNIPNTIVKRDGNGDFSANIITASLAGNASTSTQLATPRSIYGNNFDGTAALTSAIAGQFGGTGVNNLGKTISLGGNISTTADFITAGNYSTTLTSTGVTNITLPTTGTIATLAGTETLTNKTIESPTILTPTISSPSLTGTPTAPTPASDANSTQVATTAFVRAQITSSATGATATDKGIILLAGDLGGTADLPRVNTVGGVSSSTITTIASNIASATSDNTPSTIVKRDGSGNFSAGIITASLAGNSSTTTQLQTARSIYGRSFNGTADLTDPIAGTFGGTGVNNGTKTISLGGNISTTADFITAGNYTTTLTSTGVTNITLPTTGTIATLAGTETLTNKTIESPSLTGIPTAPTAATITNSTQVATTAYVNNLIASTSINSSQISGTIATDVASATSSNTANTIVKRDGSGNFSASIITAALAGNASTSTKLAAPINIYGNPFDGTVALTSAIAGTFGGTGVNNGTKTISLGGNISTTADFITAGNYTTTLTSTGVTNIILPTTGTIATLAGTETLTNKTIESPSLTGTPTAPTPASNAISTEIATAAFVVSKITASSNSIGGVSSSTITNIASDVASATSDNTPSTIVKRDGSGNFSAGIITATLAGNASTSTQLATARSIYGNNFNGGADLTAAIAGQFGGTGVNNLGKTITLGGNISTTSDFITAGNFSTTLTSTGVTNITLPTTGTIATLAGTETLTNKTIESPTILTPTISSPSLTGTPTATTPTTTTNNTQIATTAFVNNLIATTSISSSQISGTIATDIASATSSNTANAIVKRDGSGNFSAGTITASLAGNASTTTQLQTVRSIYGNDFNGTASLTSAILGTYGGTGVDNGTKTISLGGNISTTADFITAGNFTTTLTSTGITNITLPTTGTIATLAGTETLTNKTIVSPTISSPALTGSPTATTADVSSNNTLIATTAFVRSRISIDTALLIQKTFIPTMFANFSATLSGANTYLGIGDTATMLQRRYAKDVLPVSNRVAAIETSTTTLGSTAMAIGGTYTSVTGLSSLTSETFVGTLSGTANNATKLTTPRTINGVAFDGTGDITIIAEAGTLTGTSLPTYITGSSLTGVGTITSGTWSGTVIGNTKGGAGTVNGIMKANGSGVVSAAVAGTDYQTPITLGSTSLAAGGTFTSVAGLSSVTSTNFAGTLSGTASTANKLTTSKNINGVAFDGSTDITVTAASNTLTGTTLASNVTASSLTSVGTITSGVWSGTAIAVANGGTGLTATPANGQIDIGNGTGFTRTTITPGSGITISNASGGITVATTGITSANLSTTAGITNAQLANSKTTLGSTDLVLGGTVTSVTGLTSLTSTNLVGTLSGTASTANKLTATRNINGVAFDGSADITVTAASNTLTGTTLASNVVSSSLTSVGTITSGVWSGTTIAIEKGGTGLTAIPTSGQIDIGTGTGTFTRTTLTPGLGISIANGSGSIGITALAGTISGTTLASNVVTSSLTGVGTITTGTWSGTTIAVAKGGTGSTTLSGVLLGNGTSAISTATEGTNYSLVREMNEEFTVDATQAATSAASSGAEGVVSALFTLSQIPNTKSLVKIYVNGVRISNTAFRFNTNAVPGTANGSPSQYIGYIPFKNGTYKLTTGDRVQIDYYW